MSDDELALEIRGAGLSREAETRLVAAIEKYAQDKWRQGYDEGIAVANSDWP
jgi:post-segregation antitoxin (ccd killing protein)